MQNESRLSQDVWLAGADGCKARWVAVFVRPKGDDIGIRVFESFKDILSASENPAIVAVDVPIGLPERACLGGRDAENAVRPLLGKLKQSVFSIPSRRAVYAEIGPFPDQASRRAAHQRACSIAQETSDPPRRITIQAFGIFPKIREVDEILRGDHLRRQRVYETHPEMAFRGMNNQRSLSEPKKTQAGLQLRKKLLIQAGLPISSVELSPPKGAAADDLLDALACAAIARRIHAGLAEPFPKSLPRDAYGLPMAIWA